MAIIAMLAQKGGVGKTTLAVHLSVLAGDAVILDLDRQRSATDWWRARDAAAPIVVPIEAQDLARAIKRAGERHVIIDTAPAIDGVARAAARAADIVLIPTRPAILDLRAIRHTVGIVRDIGAQERTAIVINAAPPRRGTAEAGIVADTRRALTAYRLPVCPHTIGHRVALAHALVAGRAVTEFAPESEAADEIRRLWRWICK